VRVHLKGIHAVRVKLATGASATYHYAWRGGPRLTGEPGSPEFLASYTAAHASRRQPDAAKLHGVIAEFRASEDFKGLAPRTQSDYTKHFSKIEQKFGTLPLDALEDVRVTRDFLEWRDAMASPKQADYHFSTLMRLLSWARGRGLTSYRPPERVPHLYQSDRSEMIWEDTQIAAFMAAASEPLQRALVLALETGQRQGDLLRLPWSAYQADEQGRLWIRLRQSKGGGRPVNVPVTRRLRNVLDNSKRTATVILTDGRGLPWPEKRFRKYWLAACRKAGISGLHFHDLRGTAVTRLAEAGCEIPEIASITGHSLRSVSAILDKYLARTDKIALAAIAKLERGKA
jgi:integrase